MIQKRIKNSFLFFVIPCLFLMIVPKSEAVRKIGHGYEFQGNGKRAKSLKLSRIYSLSPFPGTPQKMEKTRLKTILRRQKALVRRKKIWSRLVVKNPVINHAKLLQTVVLLEQWFKKQISLERFFHIYQIQGEDQRGNVHFTGYFTPILQVKKERDSIYRYPLYRRPRSWGGAPPTRQAIDRDGVLRDKGLELAWSSNLLENYFMHVQGSGLVQYANGSTEMFHYGGKNGYSYVSIGKYFVTNGLISAKDISLSAIKQWFQAHPDQLESVLYKNPSYTFFTPKKAMPTGAGGVELTAGFSVAVDPKYIPLGACLLAEVPILSQQQKFQGHQLRLLFAQDKGAAIKGPGHLDLYMGIGEESLKKADRLHHYGRVWLLLPKKL